MIATRRFHPESGATMSHGGNEGAARQAAYDAYNNAKKADPKGTNATTRALKADLDAAVARENAAKGTPGQRRY